MSQSRRLSGPLSFGVSKAIARPEGVGGIITSIFADGTDGFYFDFSKTDRLFQTISGGSPADDAGENIALALESHGWGSATSYATMIAAQADVLANGNFEDGSTGWSVSGSDGTHIITFSGGTMRYQSDTTSPTLSLNQASALVVGQFYEVETVCSSFVSGSIKIDDALGAVTIADALGTKRVVIKAGSTSLVVVRRTANVDLTLDSIKIRRIPGNHAVQAATAAQPKWQTGGLARFDGSDDNLLTTLVPGTATSLVFDVTVPATLAATQVICGGTVGTSRCVLAINTSGQLCAGVGTDATTVIVGSTDLRSTRAKVGLVFNGSLVKLFENAVEVYSAAQNGTVGADALRLGASNNGGTAGSFWAGDDYKALAIKKALSAAEIAAITNLWGTS